MNDYEFVLKFALPNPDDDASTYLGRLEAEGCTDALVGVGKRGRIALEFVRSEVSAIAAMVGAITAVAKAIPGVHFIEAGPDLIGLTEVATLANCSRQNIYKKTLKGHLFPTAAMSEDGSELYHLSDVLRWLHESGYAGESDDEFSIRLETAQTARAVNVAFEVHSLPTKIAPEIEQVFCAVA